VSGLLSSSAPILSTPSSDAYDRQIAALHDLPDVTMV
jgi:hypothetical protein